MIQREIKNADSANHKKSYRRIFEENQCEIALLRDWKDDLYFKLKLTSLSEISHHNTQFTLHDFPVSNYHKNQQNSFPKISLH